MMTLPPSSTTLGSAPPIDAVALTAVHVRLTLVLPPETDGASMASGVVEGVTDSLAAEAELSPTLDPVVTVHERAIPFVSAETTTGELVPVALTPPHDAVY